MDLINEQNIEWTSLVQKQLSELNAIRQHHAKEQCDLLRSLLDETQKTQMKEIIDRHSRQERNQIKIDCVKKKTILYLCF